MTIPFPHCRVQRLCLILCRVPEHLKVLFSTVALVIEPPVHLVHDLLVSATLEWNHLALVVESEIEVQGDLNASSAGVQCTSDYWRSIKCGRLTVRENKLSMETSHIRRDETNKHKDALLGIVHGTQPGDVLWELADGIMSRRYKNQLVCRDISCGRKGSLPVGRLLTIAMGTGICGSCNICGQKSPKKSPSLPCVVKSLSPPS